MTGATVTVANIEIFGAATIYVCPAVLATPAVAPTSAVAYGASWTSPWVQIGSTPDDCDITIKHTATDHITKVDQYTGEVKRTRTDDEVVATFPAAEGTLQNILYSLGQGILTVGSTERTLDVGATGGQVSPIGIGIEGKGTGTTDTVVKYRRYVIWQAVTSSPTDQSLKKKAELYPNFEVTAQVCTTRPLGKEFYQVIELI